MTMQFTDFNAMPGPAAARESAEGNFLWNRAAFAAYDYGAIIVGTARDPGNTGFVTTLRAGLLLGKITATGKLKEWDTASVDGSERVYGVNSIAIKMTDADGANADRQAGSVITGFVKAGKIFTAIAASSYLINATARLQMRSKFIFDDDFWLYNPGGTGIFDGSVLAFVGASGANDLTFPDNLADALSVGEGTNNYLTFVTTNGSESINVKKKLLFTEATGTNVIGLTDNLADALSVSEAANAYLTFITTNGSETVKSTKLLTCLVGIDFTGATGVNLLKMPDNLASALDITEAANSYLKFVTTNGSEAVTVGKLLNFVNASGGVGASTAAAGTTVADAGALPAGTGFLYPTTAADGTKGVVLHANDKVTGRVLFIGNGVSNQILKVYGPSGAVINGAAADAAFSSASGKGVLIVCLSGAGNTFLAM